MKKQTGKGKENDVALNAEKLSKPSTKPSPLNSLIKTSEEIKREINPDTTTILISG